MARIAVLLASGFEDIEFTLPHEKLLEAGHEVVILGVESNEPVVGKREEAFVEVAHRAGDAAPADYDALLIPGGWSPDRLRTDPGTVEFVRAFAGSGKPIAAVCHGPQLLIEAGIVAGRTLTSWPSVRTDLLNAGATWVDREVVVDGSLITARKPDDLEAFVRELLALLPVAA